MNNVNKLSILCTAALMLAALAGNALATDVPTDAVVLERVFNDSFASILTVNNSYPALIGINDECAGPLGWANLHAWRFSVDGATPQAFANTDGFMFSADVTLSGTGDGEAGLQIAPWWSRAPTGVSTCARRTAKWPASAAVCRSTPSRARTACPTSRGPPST